MFTFYTKEINVGHTEVINLCVSNIVSDIVPDQGRGQDSPEAVGEIGPFSQGAGRSPKIWTFLSHIKGK